MSFRYHVQIERGSALPKAIIIACAGQEVVVSDPEAVAKLWKRLGARSSNEWEFHCLQGAWFQHRS